MDLCSAISLRVAAFHLPSRITPGRLCQRWSGKLMINWTSLSAGPSDSAILRASSGVRRFIIHLRNSWLFLHLKVENRAWREQSTVRCNRAQSSKRLRNDLKTAPWRHHRVYCATRSDAVRGGRVDVSRCSAGKRLLDAPTHRVRLLGRQRDHKL